jgi:uncharacterized repeat protein (TIGR03803 family)
MRLLLLVFMLSFGVAGCSQQTVSTPVPSGRLGVPQARVETSFKVLHNFKGSPDGAEPASSLLLGGNGFYGTTIYGGMGYGTAFEIGLDGAERVLHTFTFSPDGGMPRAGLTTVHVGQYYGTTSLGGTDFGSVYQMDADGKERVLYAFESFKTGANPESDLLSEGSLLYGTAGGGEFADGIVYEVNVRGTEHLVYAFKGTPDGHRPVGGLVRLGYNGMMYGATRTGGAHNYGCIYRVNRFDGTESVLYSFKGRGDGQSPEAGLTVMNNKLYGTTNRGGTDNDGTVFELSEDGTERVIHSFSGSDGAQPRARLTVMNDKLYGTTELGGRGCGNSAPTCGTVFELQIDGKMRVLHEFDGTDGKYPRASLTAYGRKLFGTTDRGGTGGLGTVFEVTP